MERRRLHWPADRDFRILSLDGGGIKGLFTTAFLARLEERFLGGHSIARYFDMIAGTSTGGIIALGLAAGKTAAEIDGMYRSDGMKIFPRSRQFGFLRNAFSNESLSQTISRAVGDLSLGDAQVRLCIPSCEGRFGDINVFKTPHHEDFRKDWRVPMREIALATSAAPSFLPIHEFGGHQYIDGGIWANNPVMVAITDALSCYEISRRQIRVISVGTGMKRPTIRTIDKMFGGVLTWLFAGGFLVENFMHYSAENASGQAGLLIGRDRLQRIEPPEASCAVGMADYKEALRILAPAGIAAAEQLPDELATSFFANEASVPQFYYGNRAA